MRACRVWGGGVAAAVCQPFANPCVSCCAFSTPLLLPHCGVPCPTRPHLLLALPHPAPPQLTALGVLMALCYIRSRNLLTPMVIHGVSNSFSLIVIYLLTSAGLDVRELIHGGAAAAGGGGF